MSIEILYRIYVPSVETGLKTSVKLSNRCFLDRIIILKKGI